MKGGSPNKPGVRSPTNTASWIMRWQRIIRLGIFALISILVGYLFLSIALAGVFVYVLTHPICNHKPQPKLESQPTTSVEIWGLGFR